MRVKTAQPVPSLDIIAIIFIIKNYDNYACIIMNII